MTRLCRDVETSLGGSLHTLSEAERLRLEQHLSECDACRHTNAVSRVVREMILSAPGALSSGARERAIEGAFQLAAVKASSREQSAHWGKRVGFALAAAAVVLLGLRVLWVDPKREAGLVSATPSSALPQSSSSTSARGDTAAGDVALESPDEAWIESVGRETRNFGPARVVLAAGTRVRFVRAANALELDRGELTLDVEHQRERSFAVLTQSFRVEVLGTQFVVSPEHVAVLRGHVEVREHKSHALISNLLAGQSYRRPAAALTRGESTQKRELEVAGSTEPNVTTRTTLTATQHRARRSRVTTSSRSLDRESQPADASTTRSATLSGQSASELIGKARTALGNGEVDTARALLERAGRVAKADGERAEVGTLQAECELLARRPVAAIRAYLHVAESFPRLRAGQNALFAAAQLRLHERDLGAARELFARYLRRYPEGHFVREARAHLHAAP